jgi:hypothetical protein
MNYSVAVFSYNHHQNLLPYCLTSIQAHLQGYQEIVVVWDDYVRTREIDFDQLRVQTGVDFRVVLHSQIHNWPKKISEWGWIKQQLAKMLCYSYSPADRTYIVDSDVLFTGDPELFDLDKIYLRYHKHCAVPDEYKFFMSQYLGMTEFSQHSWVGSTCVFDHHILKEIDQLCRAKNNMDLVQCVNHMLENFPNLDVPFSEFELYGHVSQQLFADQFVVQERNWCYANMESRPHDPIQIMWAHNDDPDLAKLSQQLTNRVL